MRSDVLFLKAPLAVCFWLNSKCNLDCPYCYAKPFSGNQMDLNRLLELIDETINLEVFDFSLAGGEPFLYKDILTVIEKLVSNKKNVAVLTNGVSVPREIIECLKSQEFKNYVTIQVSLDSDDPEVNENTRGKTSKVISNIESFIDNGITVHLATVITGYNVNSAHLLIERFYPRIKKFIFHALQPTLSTLQYATQKPEILVSKKRLRNFWVRLNNYSQKFPKDLLLPSLESRTRNVVDINPNATFHSKATFFPSACSAGHNKAEIDPDFDVLGCDIAKYHTVLGNVKCNTLEKVWKSKEAMALRHSTILPCRKMIDQWNKDNNYIC